MIGKQFQNGERVEFVMDYGTIRKGDKGVVSSSFLGAEQHIYNVQLDSGKFSECYGHRLKRTAIVTPVSGEQNAMKLIVTSADRIFPRRSYDTILKSLMEELGELSTEIAIEQGTKKRAPSADGVKGEAVDVFVVAVDMLRQAWGDKLFTPEFNEAVARKLTKWESKA